LCDEHKKLTMVMMDTMRAMIRNDPDSDQHLNRQRPDES